MKGYFLFLILILLFNCEKKIVENTTESNCKFSYNEQNTKLKWTAYKFTEKLGVSGTFHKIDGKNSSISNNPISVFEKFSFILDSNSIDSGNLERDEKIKTYFFKNLNSQIIQGKVISTSILENKGVIELELNGIKREIPVKIQFENTSLSINFELDLKDWNAMNSLKSLHSVCKELHTGKDGKSVLWPVIAISIHSKLDKNCEVLKNN